MALVYTDAKWANQPIWGEGHYCAGMDVLTSRKKAQPAYTARGIVGGVDDRMVERQQQLAAQSAANRRKLTWEGAVLQEKNKICILDGCPARASDFHPSNTQCWGLRAHQVHPLRGQWCGTAGASRLLTPLLRRLCTRTHKVLAQWAHPQMAVRHTRSILVHRGVPPPPPPRSST